ncbi:MAG TPA: hypothetical protein PLB62_09910, partial [Candidatus Sumerlaeota bacterium]|nr:hypothetical protein [Candidatus Sumerlaeota bacterium]
GSWQEGNVDLKVGRIIGDSAADMLQLYLAGLNVLGSTGNAVMASVDGWELGFEPDDGRAGEIPDLISVPGFLSSKGYQVRNDYEYPRTVDALDSYPANWATSFQSAANAGMDLFFIGGHNGYTGASLPYDGFDPADIPSKYYRFDDDLPIVMIVGCHGGLPVPDIGSWGGGSGISMVYNVIHNGARAYYGASGYSYGSPGSLHHCLWAELLLQYNFYYLISGFYQSKTLGYALQMGRINFPFGIGSNVGLDRKTVTEFNLFGIPWQRMEYPGTSRGGSRDDEQRDFEKAMPAPLKAERDLMLKPRKVVKLAQDTYQQSFTVKTSSWADKEFEKFQIIEIPGGEQQLVPDTPVLPAITKHSIALPPDGEILSLQASGVTTDTLGEFNIPTVRIGAWTESGITYTDETDMDYFYPPQLAYSREGSLNNHLITVFPVGHNPKTNETVLHPDFQVTVTYKAPVPFGILDFKADQAVLAPGQSPSFSAGIFNMGDSGVTLAGTLSLTHDDGGVGFSTTTLSIPLVPGSVFNLQSSPAGFPEVDNYRAILSLNDGMGNIVTAETPFSVISAGVMNLVAVWNPLDNKSALSVDVENLTDKTRNLTMAFVIMGSDDVWLDTVYSDPANLAAGETRTMSVVWTSPGVLTDTLKIQAVGALDGAPLNPANAEMSVFTMEALFDSLVDYILNRYTLQPGLRNIFNLNGDDVIDVADVIALIKNTR